MFACGNVAGRRCVMLAQATHVGGRMSTKSDLLEKRFLLNMGRINGLVRVFYTNFTPKPTSLFLGDDGPRADLARAIVVFLHATFEVLLRSHLPKPNETLNFHSGADIDKVLRRSHVDATPFKPLYRTLTQMAKRRTRIVHDADLRNREATTADSWGPADEWQLIMWLLAVLAFYYQLRVSIKAANVVEQASCQRVAKAMSNHREFGKRLSAVMATFLTRSPESQVEALQSLSATLALTAATLRPDVSDFKPLPSAEPSKLSP